MTKKTDAPKRLHMAGPAVIQAMDEGGNGLPTFTMTAYNGGPMMVAGWFDPVVVDLDGIQGMEKTRPILKDHSSAMVIGHTKSVTAEGGRLLATGVISGISNVARDVVGAAKNGFPWQASIGADPLSYEEVRAGASVEVNGQTVDGPVTVVRSSRLREISIVAIGADQETITSIAAEAARETPMSKQDTEAPDTAPEKTPAAKPVEASGSDPVSKMRLEAAAEAERIAAVRKAAGGDAEIAAQAIADGWSAERTELVATKARLAAIEAASMHAPNIISGGAGEQATGPVLEAAFATSIGVKNVEKHYDEQTLDAASKQFRGRLSVGELLIECARANGYQARGFRALKDDTRGVLQAAFSTRNISGILSDSANKLVLDAFNRGDTAWQEISSVRPVSDFKTVTTYRLTGETKYEKMAPDGKIKSGDVGEVSYTNKADTYAKLVGLSRQDIINDDMGVLSDMMTRLGAGAVKKMNEVFWTEFMNNGSFFTSGRGNYFEGAATPLSIDSLATAEGLFLDQTDEEGDPIGIQPAVLLVPSGLRATGFQLLNSTTVVTGAAKTIGAANPFAGRYRVVSTPYLNNAGISGNSATAWYLLADPMDLPTMQVVALDGRVEPVVESTDAMFDELGIMFRGYHDFGVTKLEYRGGVKSKGAA